MAEIDCPVCGSKVEEDELDTHKSQAHSDFTETYGKEDHEEDQRDMANDLNKPYDKVPKIPEPWEYGGADYKREGDPNGDKAEEGENEDDKLVIDNDEDLFALHKGIMDKAEMPDRYKDSEEAGASDPLNKVADISEAENDDYTETCPECGKVFDNPADAGFHAVKHDTDRATKGEEDDKSMSKLDKHTKELRKGGWEPHKTSDKDQQWLDDIGSKITIKDDTGEAEDDKPKRRALHLSDILTKVPKEAEEDTSEYEVDTDEYTKTGEPTQKLPTDKRAEEDAYIGFEPENELSDARKQMKGDKQYLDNPEYDDKQNISADYQKGGENGDEDELKKLQENWHKISTENRVKLFEAVGLTQSDAYTLAGLDYRYLTESIKKDMAKEARYNFDLEDTTEDIEDEKDEDKDETDEAYEFIYNLEENHRSRDFKKKNLTCTRCNESFYSSNDRNVHFNDLHMKAREYELPDDQPAEECPFCNQLIREPETLDWHMSEQHGANIPSTYTQTGIQGAMADADDFGIDQDFYSESRKRAREQGAPEEWDYDSSMKSFHDWLHNNPEGQKMFNDSADGEGDGPETEVEMFDYWTKNIKPQNLPYSESKKKVNESRATDLKKEIKKLTNFINMASFENPMNMGDDQAKLDSLKAELASLGESRSKEDWSQYDHEDLYPTDPAGDEWRDEGTLMQSNYDMSQQDMNRLYVDAMKEAITRAIQDGGEQMNWNYWEDLLNGWNTHTAMFDLPGTKGETPEAQQAFSQAHQEVKNWFRDQKQSVSATYPSPSWESVTNVLKAEEKYNFEGDTCPKCGSNNTVFGSTVDSMAEDQPEYLVCNKCDARFDRDAGIISESRAKEADTTKNCPLCGKSVDMGNDDEFFDNSTGNWAERGTVAMPYKMEGHFEEDHTPEDFGLDRATTHDGWTGNMSYDLYKKHFGYESRANEVFTKVSDFFENIDSDFSGDCKLCGDSMVQGGYAYDHLENKHGINVSSLTQDFTGESRKKANEIKSDAETIQDWWQLISEGNGEGDYMSMAGTGRPENSPNWEEGDPTMWEEFSSSQQQALISKAGGIGGMQERLDSEGWDGYGVDEDDAYESVSNILNEGGPGSGPRSGKKPSEMSDDELDERESKNFYEDNEDDDELDEEQAKRFYEDNESRKKGRERLDPQKTDITVCVYCGRDIDSHSNPNTDYRGMKGDAPSTDHYFSGGELGGSDDKYDFESIAKEIGNWQDDMGQWQHDNINAEIEIGIKNMSNPTDYEEIYERLRFGLGMDDSSVMDAMRANPNSAKILELAGETYVVKRKDGEDERVADDFIDTYLSLTDETQIESITQESRKAKELFGQDDPEEILGGSFGTPEDTANDLYNMTSHNYDQDEYYKWVDKIGKKVGRNDTGKFDSSSIDNWLRSQGANNQDMIYDLVMEFGGGSKALETTGDTD